MVDDQRSQGTGFLVAGGAASEVVLHGGVAMARVGEQRFDIGVDLCEAVVTGEPGRRVEKQRVDGVVIEGSGERCVVLMAYLPGCSWGSTG